MNTKESEFDALEQYILELATEIKSLDLHESRLHECITAEVNRADTAEAEEEMTQHEAAEARADAAAASACADFVTHALATVRSDLVTIELQLGPAKRDCEILEQRCSELSLHVNTMERDVQQQRLLQAEQEVLQQTYIDLEIQVNRAIDDVQRERSNLQNDLRSVEKSLASGVELRERARLAAGTHAHERRLADAELKQTKEQLREAKIEISHLKIKLTEAQLQSNGISKQALIRNSLIEESETVKELRSILETERMGVAQLKRTLDNAHDVNEKLRAELAAIDIQCAPPDTKNTSSPFTTLSNITD
ncbi:hypothetical protein EVAR_59703_1 [Eumeta japonica]|uniref:Uncharacterized protein n=1 Tax=Eumeta variegata TaxID=151549 RepID=A0A4C1ZEH5_EUMVA|nr:hypothetical protein EVAR_59703_1 [Eumeta japonica]